MEKLDTEKKKKTEELKLLVDANKVDEEKNRGFLTNQIRQCNDKILEYDNSMDQKTKEREEQKVYIGSIKLPI